MKQMKITVKDLPNMPEYYCVDVFCNGKNYVDCVEINYYGGYILIIKETTKGMLIATKNNNVKKFKIKGKIKVFLRWDIYEQLNGSP